MKDNNGMSKGFAFCEYLTEKDVNNACMYLNGIKFGTRVLNIRRTGQSQNIVQSI